ncbi:MAG: hypothetical protein H6922_00265 [Pseudomonadaceae bacterium]|nr:hypothetical protein [Pseudomonadaceae bacterium]
MSTKIADQKTRLLRLADMFDARKEELRDMEVIPLSDDVEYLWECGAVTEGVDEKDMTPQDKELIVKDALLTLHLDYASTLAGIGTALRQIVYAPNEMDHFGNLADLTQTLANVRIQLWAMDGGNHYLTKTTLTAERLCRLSEVAANQLGLQSYYDTHNPSR